MPRAMWRGAVTFGLVTIPVGLHPAVERRGELHFRLLHEKDGSPIDYRRFCEEEDVEVEWKDIVKGYEYRKGRYVVLTDEDFDKARVPATQAFEIQDFVNRADIDPVHFDHPYFLAPAGKSATKAYALLRDALAATERAGIGKIVLRRREHLAALHAAAGALMLTTLRFADEVRSPKGLDLPGKSTSARGKELELARQLIASLESEWDPGKYADEYEGVLRRVIDKKVKGEEIVAPALERPRAVKSLARALEESLKTPRRHLRAIEGGRAKERPRGQRGRARRRRRAA